MKSHNQLEQSPFDHRQSSADSQYEHFIFNYLLHNSNAKKDQQMCQLPTPIHSVSSSQFTLDNFFQQQSPSNRNGVVNDTMIQQSSLFNESDKQPLMDTSFEPSYCKQEPVIITQQHRQQRSRERRSRGNRLSRDMMHGDQSEANTHRETIDEIMMQIQSKPVPQQPRVFLYTQLSKEINPKQLQEFRERVAAKKIQRVFRAYLFYKRIKQQQKLEVSAEKRRKYQLQKILAAKVIVKHVKAWLLKKRARIERRWLIAKIIIIQRFYRKMRHQRRQVKTYNRLKEILLAVQKGWKTRKIINSLAQEIQDYVNQDDIHEKQRLKSVFMCLFESVVSYQLWLSKNNRLLYNLKQFQHRALAPNPNQQVEPKIISISPNIRNESTSSSAGRIVKSTKHVRNKSQQQSQTHHMIPTAKILGNSQLIQDLNEQNHTPSRQQAVKHERQLSQTSQSSNHIKKPVHSNNLALISTQTATFDTNDKILKGSYDVVKSPMISHRPIQKLSVEKTILKNSQVSTNIPSTLNTSPKQGNSSTRANHMRSISTSKLTKVQPTHLQTVARPSTAQKNYQKSKMEELSASKRNLAQHLSSKVQITPISQRVQRPLTSAKVQNENMGRDRINITDESMISKNKHIKHDSMTKLAEKVCFNNSMIESSSNNNIVMVSANNAIQHRTPIITNNQQFLQQPTNTSAGAKRLGAANQNYKKTVNDLETLMDEVNQYNEKVHFQKSTSTFLKLSRSNVQQEFDKLVNKLKIQMNNMLNASDPKFTFQ